jgi:hypothetical protein
MNDDTGMGDQVSASPIASADYANSEFAMRQMLARISTATLAVVTAVSNAGGVSPVGTVAVHPLVNQMNATDKAVPHGTIFNVPYFRLQGGANAVIIDPAVGDLGVLVFCDRDISAVKAAKAQANPGSYRRFDMADAIYFGVWAGGAPTQFVRFAANGIHVHSPVKVFIEAPITEASGDLRVVGAITAGYGGLDQVGLQTHTHAQGNDSHGDSELPTNAPTAGT